MNYLIPFLVQLLSYFSISQSKLVFVYSHIRHGTRGPGFGEKNMSPIHKDIYNVEWEGNGEITKVGIRMLYLLGKITRKRYNSLLTSKRNHTRIIKVRQNSLSSQFWKEQIIIRLTTRR